mgnify:CR=1 FL=1
MVPFLAARIVNLEEIFAEVEQRLQMHPLYLCISYDTDLLALESITGYIQETPV